MIILLKNRRKVRYRTFQLRRADFRANFRADRCAIRGSDCRTNRSPNWRAICRTDRNTDRCADRCAVCDAKRRAIRSPSVDADRSAFHVTNAATDASHAWKRL